MILLDYRPLERKLINFADNSPDAYEKMVDRIMQLHSYGERMALAWMDAARYGDSSVMQRMAQGLCGHGVIG